jgi:DMSO/TMAO reductase YedYZ molybdopterin-dependent catalytic subunit
MPNGFASSITAAARARGHPALLTFVATGRYGGSLPRQNGAPLRLAVP